MNDLYLRFMGANEFDALMRGETLVNNKKHRLLNRTSSDGFCFLPVNRTQVDRDLVKSVADAYEFLSGIVSEDYVVVFEDNGVDLREGYGVYADPYGDYYDTITVNEFSTAEYSNESMVPVWYCWDIKTLCDEARYLDYAYSDTSLEVTENNLKHFLYRYEVRYKSLERLNKVIDQQMIPVHRWM